MPVYTTSDNTGTVWQTWATTSATTSIYTPNYNQMTATNNTVYYTWVATGTANGSAGTVYCNAPPIVDHGALYAHEHVNVYNHCRRRSQEDAHVYRWQEHLRRRTKQRARRQSLRLLYSVLTREEWRSLRQFGWFVVRGGHTGNYYRIRWNKGDSMVANVDMLKPKAKRAANDNWPISSIGHRLCCHLPTDYPIGDMLAAQKLMIKYEEQKFIAKANSHPIYAADIRTDLRRRAA